MKITVLFFAGARERAGTGRVTVDVDASTSIADAVDAACSQAPGNASLPPNVMYARNGGYSEGSDLINDGDEIAVIPPVSGGSGGVSHAWITPDNIESEAVVSKVGSDSDGAIIVFHGITRDRNEGRRVLHLEYESYSPMAEDTMRQIIAEMKSRWEIGDVAVCHRVGRVDIGETSMVLAVSAVHRHPAFEASLYFVDRLKEIVPIWKKEYFEGGEVWIGETPG